MLKFVSNVRQLFAADGLSRRHFSEAFFFGALRVNRIIGTLGRSVVHKNIRLDNVKMGY